MQPQGAIIVSPVATKGRRWWYMFVLGIVASAGLCAALTFAVITLIDYYNNSNGKVDVRVVTPQGTNFFSVKFDYSSGPSAAYFIPVNIGTGGVKTVSSLLDTGSSDIWFDRSAGFATSSQTYAEIPKQPFKIKYMGGAVSGVIAKDTINMMSFTWQQVFGVVDPATNSVQLEGLVGLSRGGCDPRGLCVLSNWPLKYSAISFYYDPSTWAGLFMAGFVDPAMYCSPGTNLTYIPQTGTYYWAGATGLSFNGRNLGEKLTAIFDTGTTYIMFNQSLYNKVNAILQSDGCLNPVIKLTLSGVVFTIPTSVIVRRGNANGNCRLRLDVFTSSLPCDILVGAVFLVNFYSVFDLEGERMGFCPAKVGLTKARRLEEEADFLSQLLDDPRRLRRQG